MQLLADTQTTAVLLWSLATPTAVTVAYNSILGDAIGIWVNPMVTTAGASTNNRFYGVTTAVGLAAPAIRRPRRRSPR